MPRVLRLKQAFEETVKAGTDMPDRWRTAVILVCVQRRIKTPLNLSLGDGCKYSDVCEQVMLWDRARANGQAGLARSSVKLFLWRSTELKVERAKARTRKAKMTKDHRTKGSKKSSKGSWKGGGKDGKSKNYDNNKGKGKNKSNTGCGTGREKGDQKVCYQRGAPGHCAKAPKDCWNAARAAQTGHVADNINNHGQRQQGQPVQQPAQQQQQPPQQATQYRVARIAGGDGDDDDDDDDDDDSPRVFQVHAVPTIALQVRSRWCSSSRWVMI